MSWFIDGIKMSQEEFEQSCAIFHRGDWCCRRGYSFFYMLEQNYNSMLKCWAYAFFKGGAGYNSFRGFLRKDVFNLDGEAHRVEWNALWNRISQYIAEKNQLDSNALRRWFFKHCWLIEGSPSESGGRPRGHASPMSRSIVALADALSCGDTENERISELMDDTSYLASTLNDKLLKEELISIISSTGAGAQVVTSAIARFSEDATKNGSRPEATARWRLDTSHALPRLLLQLESFRHPENFYGKQIKFALNGNSPIYSCIIPNVKPLTIAFDGMSVLRNCLSIDNLGRRPFSLVSGNDSDSDCLRVDLEDFKHGFRLLSAAQTQYGKPCLFNENVGSRLHRLVDTLNVEDGDACVNISRSLFAIGRPDVLGDKAYALLSGSSGLAVARIADELELDRVGEHNLNIFGHDIKYVRRSDASLYIGENEDVWVCCPEGRKRMHAFSGQEMQKIQERGDTIVLSQPSESNSPCIYSDAPDIVYIPQAIVYAAKEGSHVEGDGWRYEPCVEKKQSIFLRGARRGVLNIYEIDFEIEVKITIGEPYFWLEKGSRSFNDMSDDESCLDGERVFNGWDDDDVNSAVSWVLCCLMPPQVSLEGRAIRYNLVGVGIEDHSISSLIDHNANDVLRIELKDSLRFNERLGSIINKGEDSVSYVADGAERPLVRIENVAPKKLRMFHRGDSLCVYAPSSDANRAIVVLSEKAFDMPCGLCGRKDLFRVIKVGSDECPIDKLISIKCPDGMDDRYAVYALDFDAEKVAAIEQNFYALKDSRVSRIWHLLRRDSDLSVADRFMNPDLVRAHLEVIDRPGRKPLDFKSSRTFLDSYEATPEGINSYWKRRINAISTDNHPGYEQLNRVLHELLEHNVNFLATPEPAQDLRRGWDLWSWADKIFEMTCRQALRQPFYLGQNNYSFSVGGKRKFRPFSRVIDEFQEWFSLALAAPLLHSDHVLHIYRTAYNRTDLADALSSAGIKECEIMMRHGLPMDFSMWSRQTCDFEEARTARQDIFVSRERISELIGDVVQAGEALFGPTDEVCSLSSQLSDAAQVIYKDGWPKPESDYSYLLGVVLRDLAEDTERQIIPVDMAYLLLAAIASRTEARIAGQVQFLSPDIEVEVRNVVRKAFNKKFNDNDGRYWSVLMYYSIAVDMMMQFCH